MQSIVMPPCYFRLLMHYYCSPEEHEDVVKGEFNGNVKWLLEQGLICERDADDREYGGTYRATDRGTAYVVAALSTPLPVQRWVIPEMPDRRCK